MRIIRVLILITFCGVAALWAEDQQKSTPKIKPPPSVRIRAALGMELVSLDAKEHTLNELLQLFGKLTSEKFTLDPALPKSIGETKVVIRTKKGGTVQEAFGVALALTGLRYGILDNALFISTEGKLADRLLFGGSASEAIGATKARQPMTVAEAVHRNQVFDPDKEGFVTARNFISHSPWRHWEPPSYNPKTGLTDFPGPPVWMESPDVGHPRFRYTSTPYFLKPEYLALEQEKREFKEERRYQDRKKERAKDSTLRTILDIMKAHPDWKAKDILKQLEGGSKN